MTGRTTTQPATAPATGAATETGGTVSGVGVREFLEKTARSAVSVMEQVGKPVWENRGQIATAIGLADGLTRVKQALEKNPHDPAALEHFRKLRDYPEAPWNKANAEVQRLVVTLRDKSGYAGPLGGSHLHFSPAEAAAGVGFLHPASAQTVDELLRANESVREAVPLLKRAIQQTDRAEKIARTLFDNYDLADSDKGEVRLKIRGRMGELIKTGLSLVESSPQEAIDHLYAAQIVARYFQEPNQNPYVGLHRVYEGMGRAYLNLGENVMASASYERAVAVMPEENDRSVSGNEIFDGLRIAVTKAFGPQVAVKRMQQLDAQYPDANGLRPALARSLAAVGRPGSASRIAENDIDSLVGPIIQASRQAQSEYEAQRAGATRGDRPATPRAPIPAPTSQPVPAAPATPIVPAPEAVITPQASNEEIVAAYLRTMAENPNEPQTIFAKKREIEKIPTDCRRCH